MDFTVLVPALFLRWIFVSKHGNVQIIFKGSFAQQQQGSGWELSVYFQTYSFVIQKTGNLKCKDVCQMISREYICLLTYL